MLKWQLPHFLLCAIVLLVIPVSAMAQTYHLNPLKAIDLAKFNIPTGNYSGITWLGGEQYAVVSDKELGNGYFPFTITIDSLNGTITHVARGAYLKHEENTTPSFTTARDCEGVAYVATTQRVFISGESDQRIIACDRAGKLTGEELFVPEQFSSTMIYPNYGFESLAYDPQKDLLWTTTESVLRADGEAASWQNATENKLRLQAFNSYLKPFAQYAYRTDAPQTKTPNRYYAFGVVALACSPEGELWVMEREFQVSKRFLGSTARIKIYRVNTLNAPTIDFDTSLIDLPEDFFLPKELIYDSTTSLSLSKRSLANYEGFCFGPKLADGRQALLLISDSQGGAGNSFYRMKDYLKVIVVNKP